MSMTREKAIEYLEWIRPKKPFTLDRKNVQTSIDMAIEALKKEGGDSEKEGGKNDGDNHNGDNLRNACNAGGDRQREKEEVIDELYGIHDFIVDMLCGSELTAEERNTVERIRQRVLDGIRNISKR